MAGHPVIIDMKVYVSGELLTDIDAKMAIS